jgi:hypothetical protein
MLKIVNPKIGSLSLDILKLAIYNYQKFTTLQKLDSLFHHTVSAKMRLSVIPFFISILCIRK